MATDSRPELRLDWCSHAAAKYAVEHWHYSERLPLPPLVTVGAWERGKYIGCLIFARGANKDLATRYGLTHLEACELVRVALDRHRTPVSRIMSVATRFLRKQCPGLRLIISFADPAHGHHGGICQATNWVYTGTSDPQSQYFHGGRWKHQRSVTGTAFGEALPASLDYRSLPRRRTQGKHRYLMPLDDAMRARIAPLARPYPKRAGSSDGGMPADQAGGGGSIPTPALPPPGEMSDACPEA